MKKIGLFYLFIFVFSGVSAQTWSNYRIKAQYMHGTILRHNQHLDALVQGSSRGGTVAVEFQTMGERAWHQFLGFPQIGAGLVFMDFSNPEILGRGIALYPYMNVPLVRTNFFNLNLKPGAGATFVNRFYGNTIQTPGTLQGANSAIGSVMNVFLTLGANVEIPLAGGFSLTADYAWNHVSNGSIVQPNSGINMLNAYVGLRYTPNHRNIQQPQRRNWEDVPRNFSFEIMASGGITQLHYRNDNNYVIASLSFGVYRPMSNWYRMGVGADVFYNSVFGVVNVPGKPGFEPSHRHFRFTYIEENLFRNKIRAGVSWHHEFMVGRLTAGFHFGLYLYDPIKNLQPRTLNESGEVIRPEGNKGLIYRYNIDVEDGWLYTRAIARYAITNNLFVSVGLKTHLQRAEFIDWGIGWRF